MLKVELNGEAREIAAGCTVSEMLALNGYAGRKVAVEINREIVPRSQHDERTLRDGDHVEVVHAMGGG
jgi:sulfur carrier protein